MELCSKFGLNEAEGNCSKRDYSTQQDAENLGEEENGLDLGMELVESEGGSADSTDSYEEWWSKYEAIDADKVLRMEFNSPEEARLFYNDYSLVKGFATKQGKKIKNMQGEIVRYTFVCNRDGFRDKKWLEKSDRKREHKVVTRCGCLAELRIKRKSDSEKWYVSRFVEEHNHELLMSKFVEYLRSHRKISDFDKAQLNSMREVSISIPKIYESFAAQAGGFKLVPFTKQDMYNELRRQRALQNGDVNAAIRFFEGMGRVDDKFYWQYRVGDAQQLCDLFWSDGLSQEDYHIFGDVLAFDATYGRNKYNLPVVVFSGVNHHNQTCVFATAMVSNESQASYIWVLQKLLECMQGKGPKAVITDGDPAMRGAIQEVFPGAHHRLCAWHLLRNATANICQPRFTQLFRQCMLADMEISEFERMWDAMVEECGVRKVDWVNDLYGKKHAWATAYIRGQFFAGIRTTSRCESLHAKLGRFVKSRYGILEFVTNFQRCVDFLRDNEDELDFRSCYGTPVLQTQFVELEKSAAMKFTREIFFRVRESLQRCVRVSIIASNSTTDGEVYFLQKYRRPGLTLQVVHESDGQIFRCTCLRMESFGLPCVHILAVLVRLHVGVLPNSLVLRRWSKNAKNDVGLLLSVNDSVDSAILYKRRVGGFVHLCKRLAKFACLSQEDYKLYAEKIVRDTRSLEAKHGNVAEFGAPINFQGQVSGLNDPIRVRTKGTGRGNTKATSTGKQRRKCSNCGRLGHRGTRCTNPSKDTDVQQQAHDVTAGPSEKVVDSQRSTTKRKKTDVPASFPRVP